MDVWAMADAALAEIQTGNDDANAIDLHTCACGGTKAIGAGGFTVCTTCGAEDPFLIDAGADWHSNAGDGGKSYDGSRCGMPMETQLYSEKWNLGTRARGNHRLARIAMHSSMNHKDRALFHSYKEFDEIAEKIGVSREDVYRAKVIYKKFSETRLTRGLVRKGVKANCLHYACAQGRNARTTREVCDAFGILTKDMGRTVTMFREAVVGKTVVEERDATVTNADGVATRLCNKIPGITGRQRMKCVRLCDQLNECVALMGKTPTGIATTVLFVVLAGQMTKGEVCAACGVSIPTVTKLEPIVRQNIAVP